MKHLFYHLLLCIHSSLIKCGLKCKGSTYSFFLQNCNFLITFFELYRNIKYIMLSIFRKIEVFFKKNWQNRIKDFKSGRTRAIWKWKILKPLKELFSSCYNRFLIFFNRWVILFNKVLWGIFFNGILDEL